MSIALDGPAVGTLPGCSGSRSEEHTSELQSHVNLVCRLLLEKKKEVQEHNRRAPDQHERACGGEGLFEVVVADSSDDQLQVSETAGTDCLAVEERLEVNRE